MKRIFVTGNVGKDPETRYAPNGDSFVTFSLAVTTGPKNNQKTDWLEISCNGKTAEVVQSYVRKGSKLLVEGTPSASAYINKEGKPIATLRVSASNIEFIGSKERSEDASNDGGSNHAPDYVAHPDESAVAETGFNAPGPSLKSDDIPF
jgi:single-strand DNA-binding protein